MDRNRIEEALLKMGIPANMKGFRYITDAVQILMEDLDTPLVKVIYADIAKKNKTKSSRVERCIRSAFERARSEKGDYEIVEHYIGFINCENSASLHLLAKRIREEYESLDAPPSNG